MGAKRMEDLLRSSFRSFRCFREKEKELLVPSHMLMMLMDQFCRRSSLVCFKRTVIVPISADEPTTNDPAGAERSNCFTAAASFLNLPPPRRWLRCRVPIRAPGPRIGLLLAVPAPHQRLRISKRALVPGHAGRGERTPPSAGRRAGAEVSWSWSWSDFETHVFGVVLAKPG